MVHPDPIPALPEAIDVVIERQWSRLGAPGSWMTGEERTEVVRIARSQPRRV